jgi:hypothetical protein
MKFRDSITLRRAVAGLALIFALSQPITAEARGGGGFHGGGGGFHGADAFHSVGGFHGAAGFHSVAAFHGGGMHVGGLHAFGRPLVGSARFDHWHDRGIGDGWWGDVPYVDDGDDSTVAGQYWYYCQSPAGFYPYVTSCSTGWQPVPAS